MCLDIGRQGKLTVTTSGCLGQRIRQVWPDCIPDRLTIFPVLQLKNDTGLKRSGS